MKIYFAGSIRGGREDVDIYRQIIEYLQKYGQVLNPHVGDQKITSQGEMQLPVRQIFERDMNWLKECDLVVAEVSTPSLGVGYEIGCAIEHQKKVFCLYRSKDGKSLSAMIAGSPGATLFKYNDPSELKEIIDKIFL